MLLSTSEGFNFQVLETVICNSHSKKLLGVVFDNKLRSEKHINTICQRASRELNTVVRLNLYMELDKRNMVMNALFDSQFNYYPAILVCHICSLNNQTDSKNAVDEFNTTITIQTLKNTKRKTILPACT